MEPTTTTTAETRPKVQPSLWVIGAKGGIYTGLVLILFSLIGFVFEMSRDNIGGTIFTIISFFIGIYLTHGAYKNQGNGYMTYGQGLGLGAILGLVSGFLNAIFMTIYLSFIDPNVIVRQMEQVRIELENKGMSDAQIDQAMYISEFMVSPIALFFLTIIGSVFYAFIIALIVSAFTKNTDPEHEF